MNEDKSRIIIKNSNMGSTTLNSNCNTTTATNLEKRTLPVLYVQSPISKNLNSGDVTNSLSVPKSSSSPVTTSVTNGVNGGKTTLQAFVGTLVNNKSSQKVILTPVKPGQDKQTALTRILLQNQRPGTMGQVARVTATSSTPAVGQIPRVITTNSPSSGGGVTAGTTISPTLNVQSNKAKCNNSFIVSAISSSSNSSSNNISSAMSSNSLMAKSGTTISIRNAVIINSQTSNTQTKSAQPNIIRQKIVNNANHAVNSLLKSGTITSALLSKVLTGQPIHPRPSIMAANSIQMKNDKKTEDLKVTDVVLIDDDDDDDDISSGQKSVNKLSIQENSISKPNIGGIVFPNGVKNDPVLLVNGHINTDLEIKVKNVSPVGDRARKRKGQLGVSIEPPPKVQKVQDKIKLLPGAEDFDPFKVVEWEPNGTGLLPGSNIKMAINELGMLTVADNTLAERGTTTTATDEADKKVSKKGHELDSILCCICCNCYGLPAEFYNGSYCSISCRDAVSAQEDAIVKKLEREQEKQSDIDQKKKTTQDFPSSSSNSSSSSVISLSSSDDKEDKETTVKTKKKSLKNTVLEAKADKTEDRKKLPGFMDGVLKKHSTNEDDYNAAVTKARKIVKKGKILNSNIKESKKSLKSDYKNSPLTSKSESISKQKSNEVIRTKAGKLPIKDDFDIPKIRHLLPIKHKKLSEVCQDLDCGILAPSQMDKGEDSDVEQFPWAKYLEETKSRPAWVKLFNYPFPGGINLFQEGYKLEAIDPEHQANICAVTVIKVKGYRIKLHFDCYSSKYDFWTNVDSPNIFPCGFCARHGITLNPPKGHGKDTFNWLSYNTMLMAIAAPTSCFPSYLSNSFTPNLFRVGMKLEAVDRKNTFLVCVATVAGVIDNRILVHFDSWGEVYDYWVDTSSPYIRPIGWCKKNNHELTPPNGYKPNEFSWAEYLASTKSEPAPKKAFTLRPHHDFRRGMKLEAIDKRAPHLLKVATVKDVLPYQIKIGFDGFPDQFGYWVDDDSPDIHPAGWGARTGHPVETPPDINSSSPCPTPGCVGQGNMRNPSVEAHINLQDCPYSLDHLNSDPLIPDRLQSGDENSDFKNEEEIINLDDSADDDDESDTIEKKRWKWLGVREGVKKVKEVEKSAENTAKKNSSKKIKGRKKKRRYIYQQRMAADNKDTDVIEPTTTTQDDWEKMEPLKSENDPLKWSINQVVEFTKNILGSVDTNQMENEEIDGKGFLLLSVGDLTDYLGFNKENAEKICEKISYLRSKVT